MSRASVAAASRLTLATSRADAAARNCATPASAVRGFEGFIQAMSRGAQLRWVLIGLLGLAGLALSGCETDMAGAAAYVGGIGGPSAAAPSAQPVQLFIASTRKGEHGAAAQVLSGDGVHYAFDILTIPPGHRVGSLEEPMFGAANAREHIVLSEERNLDGDEFRSELASHISGRIGANRDVLVFVHGFNTPFDEARERAAQIVADSRFGGVAVLFTWPTKHELFGYVSDKDNATASRDALQSLLQTSPPRPASARCMCSPTRWAAGWRWRRCGRRRSRAIATSRDTSARSCSPPPTSTWTSSPRRWLACAQPR